MEQGFVHECLEKAVKKNTETIESCKVLLELLEAHPELDRHIGVAFGIQPQMPFKQV